MVITEDVNWVLEEVIFGSIVRRPIVRVWARIWGNSFLG